MDTLVNSLPTGLLQARLNADSGKPDGNPKGTERHSGPEHHRVARSRAWVVPVASAFVIIVFSAFRGLSAITRIALVTNESKQNLRGIRLG
jgi:hypothetical protein